MKHEYIEHIFSSYDFIEINTFIKLIFNTPVKGKIKLHVPQKQGITKFVDHIFMSLHKTKKKIKEKKIEKFLYKIQLQLFTP